MIRAAIIAGLATSLLSVPTLAESRTPATVHVWQVDTSGHPPFKRTRVELSAVDAASMEIAEDVVATERVWTTDFSGRPPFQRGFEELPVIDAASLEADIEAEVSRAIKAKPFFKQRHR